MGSSGTRARGGQLQRLARQVLPLLVSGAILYHALRDIDFGGLAAAALRANLWVAIPAVVVPQLLSWWLGTLVVARTLQWFHGPFPLRTYFWVRGVAYILTFVNTALGAGGTLLYQQRRAGISWRKLMGIVLFRVGLGLWGIGLIMIPLTWLMQRQGLHAELKLDMTIWWGVLVAGTAWLVEAWLMWHHGITLGFSRWVTRGGDGEFWTAFRESRPRHWWMLWAMFLPQYIVMILAYDALNRAFGIDAPFLQSMVTLPFAIAIMDLPIAFAGFGTATLAWSTLFGAHGSPEAIVALTLVLPGARLLTRAAIGVLSLRPGLAAFDALSRVAQPQPSQTAPPAQAAPESDD